MSPLPPRQQPSLHACVSGKLPSSGAPAYCKAHGPSEVAAGARSEALRGLEADPCAPPDTSTRGGGGGPRWADPQH
ncbi:hypothetical protein ACRAWD_21310 [Caulobacter segnis]